MNFRLMLAGVAGIALLVSGSTQAALISVTDAFGNSNISIVEGTPTVDVYVRIAQNPADMGNTNISSMGLRFVVGDGGPPLAGVDLVPITAVAYTSTGAGTNASVWDPQSGNLVTSEGIALPSSSATIANATITLANTNVQFGPGVMATVLAVFTLDTSSLMAGDSDALGTLGGFLLNPDNVGSPTTAFFTGGGGVQTPIPLSFATGTLSVTAIPEPASFLLLSLGAVGAVAGRRYRRRSKADQQSTTAA